MKNIIKIIAIVGTGMVIGTVAGKFLKTERRQAGRIIRDLTKEDKSLVSNGERDYPDELESYFI